MYPQYCTKQNWKNKRYQTTTAPNPLQMFKNVEHCLEPCETPSTLPLTSHLTPNFCMCNALNYRKT